MDGCFDNKLVCRVSSQVCPFISLAVGPFFTFFQHPFSPMSDPPASSVWSNFHVGAERRSPPLSAVISLLKLNRQSNAIVHVFSLTHPLFSPPSIYSFLRVSLFSFDDGLKLDFQMEHFSLCKSKIVIYLLYIH